MRRMLEETVIKGDKMTQSEVYTVPFEGGTKYHNPGNERQPLEFAQDREICS